LKVDDYSRQVIDAYRQNAGHMDQETAKAATIAAASTMARDEGRLAAGDAARVAKTAIETFDKQAREGVPLDKARENVAHSMAGQFDSRGKVMQREERQQSIGLGI
jgi:hypothetical protein